MNVHGAIRRVLRRRWRNVRRSILLVSGGLKLDASEGRDPEE
jgi:hypothetical protein